MSLFFVVGIYFYARGVFALFGQTLFFTKRTLELIDETQLSAYLKESGLLHIAVATVFVGKALLDVVFPVNKIVTGIFFALLLLCVVFLSRCNEKYLKKNATK